MKKINPKKNKHLTGEDRKEIEECLGKGMAFKHIARHIGKDPTTVSYEVKHHRVEYRNSYTRTDDPCSKLLKAPFVCNACEKKPLRSCPHVRYIYRATPAQQEYKTLLSEAREGIPLNKESSMKMTGLSLLGCSGGSISTIFRLIIRSTLPKVRFTAISTRAIILPL